MQIFSHRDIDMWGRVWMSRFRGAWKSLNFYKEYLFRFETLIFNFTDLIYAQNSLKHSKDKGKHEIVSYDPLNSKTQCNEV